VINNLLNNAIISIKLGVEDYFSPDPNRILSCVRNLFSGLILLFKSKLLDLSPPESNEVLIKKDIIALIKNNNLIFKGNGKNTINTNEIKKRFMELGIKTDWIIVEKIRNERNNIEHYYTNINSGTLRGLVVDIFHIVNDFTRNELKQDPKVVFKETWTKMLEIETVFIIEKNECDKKISIDFNVDENQLGIIRNIYCNRCGFELLMPKEKTNNLNNAILSCANCSNEISVNNVFENIVDIIYNSEQHDNIKQTINICPNCGKNTFYIVDNICFYCSYENNT
jgi:ribosomal protein L37E